MSEYREELGSRLFLRKSETIEMELVLPDYPLLNAAEVAVCRGKVIAADGCALALLKPADDGYIFPRTHCSKHEFDAPFMTALRSPALDVIRRRSTDSLQSIVKVPRRGLPSNLSLILVRYKKSNIKRVAHSLL
jgi:hypothetical protein